jgi:hypothetical protein
LVVSRPTLINAMPPTIAAYVAGLVDGEGTITLTRLHAGENRRLVVSIANTGSYKRARASMALERYLELTPRNGKYTARCLSNRRAFEKDFLALLPMNDSSAPGVHRCATLGIDEEIPTARSPRARRL